MTGGPLSLPGSPSGPQNRRDFVDRPLTVVTPDDVPDIFAELVARMTTTETISIDELMRRRAEREGTN